MHDLQPFNALGGNVPLRADIGTVTLRETPNVALASVAARLGHESACITGLNKLIGSDLPGPGKATLGTPFDAIWVSPDQWMISAPYDTHEDLADRLKATLLDHASVTEQSDAWVCLDLVGPDTDPVMELLCNLDIRAMAIGDAARTVIHHLGCFVIRMEPEKGLRIQGPRASAGSLHHAIKTAMTSAL